MSSGEVQVRTYVQIRSDLILPDGTRLGSITPIQTEVGNIKVCILHVELEKPIEPSDLKAVENAINQLKKWLEGEVIILSGRGPIWMYVVLAHTFHGIAPCVAVLDPKLQGAVVVMTHTRKYELGQVIKLPPEVMEKLVQVKTP